MFAGRREKTSSASTAESNCKLCTAAVVISLSTLREGARLRPLAGSSPPVPGLTAIGKEPTISILEIPITAIHRVVGLANPS